MTTASIEFRSLWTYRGSQSSVRLPLRALVSSSQHVHGELVICLGGERLPYLGYFGPDDVCFNTWLQELVSVESELMTSEHARYVFDEGEQGQPAFEFVREGDMLFTSVVASEISGAGEDPSYQRVGSLWSDFQAAVGAFKQSLRAALGAEAGPLAEDWWSRNAGSAA